MGDVSKLHQDMIAGIKKPFNTRRKVDSKFAAMTSVGSLFQMSEAATEKARLPTVDSMIGGRLTTMAVGVGRAEWSSTCHELCKNGLTDQDAMCDAELGRLKELCISR